MIRIEIDSKFLTANHATGHKKFRVQYAKLQMFSYDILPVRR
jgi:hypothetical protein